MSEQNKETTQQLKELALDLQNIAMTMRSQYRLLSFLVNTEVLFLFIISIFVALCNRIVREFDSVFSVILLLLIINFFAIINYMKLRKQGISFRKKYQEGRKILQIMADKAEWTRYKKRLIYKGNDEKTSNAVDFFFYIAEKKWSPCRTEKKYYAFLLLTVPFFIIYSFIAFVVKVTWGI